MPIIRLINKEKAKGFVCEKKGQEVNWVVFVEWMIRDQLQRIKAFQMTMEGVEVGGVGDAEKEQPKEEAMLKDMWPVCFQKGGQRLSILTLKI
jgi:hypothetical protein